MYNSSWRKIKFIFTHCKTCVEFYHNVILTHESILVDLSLCQAVEILRSKLAIKTIV